MNKLPKGWKLIKLGDVCDLQNGYAFKSKDYVDFSNTLNCRMSNIRPDGVFDLNHNQKFLPDSYAEKYSQYLLQDGDVIIAMTDMATEAKILGVPTVVNTKEKNLLLNQRVGKLIIKNPNILYFPYLQYSLNREQVKKYYLKFAGGGLQINLGKSDLLSVQIPLPPLEEQKRIAKILDKADEIRRKRKESIRLTDELLRSTFLDMFGDIKSNRWKLLTVEDIIEKRRNSIRTGPFGSRLLHSEFVDKGIAVLGIDNAVQNTFQWAKPRFITEEKYTQLKRFTVYPDDVIITIMGTCGRCAIVPHDCPKAINTKHLCCITLDQKKCLPEFLHSYFLIHPEAKKYLQMNVKGAIMNGLNLTIIKKLPVPLVPISLQKEYKEICEKQKIVKNKYNESLQESENLFNSLLQRAFKGEL